MTQRELIDKGCGETALEPYPLSTMRKILDCIETTQNIRVDISRIPLDDKKILDIFRNGDTDGVFGFDSSNMQEYSKQLKPICLFEGSLQERILFRNNLREIGGLYDIR